MMLQSDVSHCCVIHNCEVKSIRISQQAVQTEQPSDEIRRADPDPNPNVQSQS